MQAIGDTESCSKNLFNTNDYIADELWIAGHMRVPQENYSAVFVTTKTN